MLCVLETLHGQPQGAQINRTQQPAGQSFMSILSQQQGASVAADDTGPKTHQLQVVMLTNTMLAYSGSGMAQSPICRAWCNTVIAISARSIMLTPIKAAPVTPLVSRAGAPAPMNFSATAATSSTAPRPAPGDP